MVGRGQQSSGGTLIPLYNQAEYYVIVRLPRWLGGKESACQVGDTDSVPGSGRSPGEGNGNPLQYSCLGNPMDRGAWRAIVHRVTKR